MNKIYLLIAFFSLQACTALTYTTQTNSVSDRFSKQEKYAISCITLSSCYAKAEKICENGYNILKASKNLNAIPNLTHDIEVSCIDPNAKKNTNDTSDVKSDTLLFNKTNIKK
jgi:hypothetical protein